jgi:hypothetical protein
MDPVPRLRLPRSVGLAAAACAVAMLGIALAAGVVGLPAVQASGPTGAQTISTDPYTTGSGQHATEVEPFAAAFGNTIVSAFQVGRYNAGCGATNTGWATSTDGGQSWTNGLRQIAALDAESPEPAHDGALVAVGLRPSQQRSVVRKHPRPSSRAIDVLSPTAAIPC